MGLINKYSSIRSDNGLVLARWQSIIWTNNDYFIDYINCVLSDNESALV